MISLRIIVVEDDALIGVLLADMLRDLGHTVCDVVASESAAVTAAARHLPDLIIMDVGLGRGNGLRAIDSIMQTGAVPHVFMSGSRLAIPRAGAVFLLKPFAQRDLVQAMHHALEPIT